MEPIELRSPWPAATVLGAPPVCFGCPRCSQAARDPYQVITLCDIPSLWVAGRGTRTDPPVRAGTGPGQPRDPGRGEQPDPSDLCL